MAETLIPCCAFRWVDKSTNPQIHTEKVLQQAYQTTSGKTIWKDVPFAGHISEVQP